ncbi:hypothetical protein [Nitratifractor sp.]
MKQTIALASLAFLLAGCSFSFGQPDIDPAVKKEVVVDKKTYEIPLGTVPSAHVATAKEIEFYKKSGVKNCKRGDILWEAESVKEKVSKAIESGDASIHAELAQKGLIGCASPVK